MSNRGNGCTRIGGHRAVAAGLPPLDIRYYMLEGMPIWVQYQHYEWLNQPSSVFEVRTPYLEDNGRVYLQRNEELERLTDFGEEISREEFEKARAAFKGARIVQSAHAAPAPTL